MKEMPERIYLFDCNDAMTVKIEGDTEYIRKDIVDEMIKTAEDHAFFAGSEYAREEVIEKACKWIEMHTCVFKSIDEVDMFKDLFKKAMEEQV